MIEAWLEAFVGWLRAEGGQRGREAVEVLSDVSGEPYLNAVAARHLHRYGRERKGVGFWVRSEWEKVDISYGMSSQRLESWAAGRRSGWMGDLGQIEVKVLYTTSGKAKKYFESTIDVLGRQLRDRQKRGLARSPPSHGRPPEYHGVVWLHDHGRGRHDTEARVRERVNAASAAVEEALIVHGLEYIRAGTDDDLFRFVCRENLGESWPIVDGDYVGELRVLLVRLPTA